MQPIVFQLGAFNVTGYGLMLAVSFVVGTWLARRRARQAGMDRVLDLDLYLYIAIAALLGSRLQFMAENLAAYTFDPSSAVRTWEGGLSMQTGVVLAILTVFVYTWAKRASFTMAADLLAPSVALGTGLTRLGCFMNGCCFGGPCGHPWAVVFPRFSPAGMQFPGVPIHPTQLYLSLAGFAIFGALLVAEKRGGGHGRLFALLLILDSTARFFVDFLRYYDPSAVVFTIADVAITHYQVIGAGLFVAGWYFFWRSGRLRRNAARQERVPNLLT